MAALTGSSAVKSSVYKRQVSTDANRDSIAVTDSGAKKRISTGRHTFVAGEGSESLFGNGDEMNLVILPAGCTIDLKESYLKFSATPGSGEDFAVGYRAYTAIDGSTVAEDANGLAFETNAAVYATRATLVSSSAAGNAVDALGLVKFNSKGPVTIFLKGIGGSFDGDIGDVWDWQFCYWVD
jgi:hypothetical protein